VSAVFLDRDGVINDIIWGKWINTVDDMIVYPWAASAIKILNDLDIPVFVVTNQSGVHLGALKHSEYYAITAKMLSYLESEGAKITRVYECFHQKDEIVCECRKPGTLMVERAVRDYNLDRDSTMWLVGDMASDIELALNAHLYPIMVRTGLNNDEQEQRAVDIAKQSNQMFAISANLYSACETIKRQYEHGLRGRQ
jgi:D-glycero-D-manno-heptose 1,7-bisphosphate phosphatase